MRSGCAAARGSSAGDAMLIAVAVYVMRCKRKEWSEERDVTVVLLAIDFVDDQ